MHKKLPCVYHLLLLGVVVYIPRWYRRHIVHALDAQYAFTIRATMSRYAFQLTAAAFLVLLVVLLRLSNFQTLLQRWPQLMEDQSRSSLEKENIHDKFRRRPTAAHAPDASRDTPIPGEKVIVAGRLKGENTSWVESLPESATHPLMH